MDDYIPNRARLFSEVQSERMRGTHLQLEKFQLEIKHFFFHCEGPNIAIPTLGDI